MPTSAVKNKDEGSNAGVANSSRRKAMGRAVRPSVERNIKNEGASGDVDENKGTGKSTCAKARENA